MAAYYGNAYLTQHFALNFTSLRPAIDRRSTQRLDVSRRLLFITFIRQLIKNVSKNTLINVQQRVTWLNGILYSMVTELRIPNEQWMNGGLLYANNYSRQHFALNFSSLRTTIDRRSTQKFDNAFVFNIRSTAHKVAKIGRRLQNTCPATSFTCHWIRKQLLLYTSFLKAYRYM